jgi:hypothetical protein
LSDAYQVSSTNVVGTGRFKESVMGANWTLKDSEGFALLWPDDIAGAQFQYKRWVPGFKDAVPNDANNNSASDAGDDNSNSSGNSSGGSSTGTGESEDNNENNNSVDNLNLFVKISELETADQTAHKLLIGANSKISKVVLCSGISDAQKCTSSSANVIATSLYKSNVGSADRKIFKTYTEVELVYNDNTTSKSYAINAFDDGGNSLASRIVKFVKN